MNENERVHEGVGGRRTEAQVPESRQHGPTNSFRFLQDARQDLWLEQVLDLPLVQEAFRRRTNKIIAFAPTNGADSRTTLKEVLGLPLPQSSRDPVDDQQRHSSSSNRTFFKR